MQNQPPFTACVPYADLFSQKDAPLLDALLAYAKRRMLPFHMPGHRGGGFAEGVWRRRGKDLFSLDLTEISEVVSGRDLDFFWRAAEELAARAFGARRSYFLVNGASSGILAALLSVGCPGAKILIARNCHLSVINGLILSGLLPVFIPPRWIDGHPALPPRTVVEEALRRHPDAVALLVTNPGYQGICGPLAGVAAAAESAGIPLLVDEAHGGHLCYLDREVEASAAGADLWVWGTHKLMGSLTQTGLLHLGSEKIPADRVEQALSLIGSTSPSYILLASLDSTRRHLYLNGRELFARAAVYGEKIRKELSNLPGVKVLTGEELPPGYGLDPLKVVFSLAPAGWPGYAAEKVLREKYRVQVEYADSRNVYLIISPAQKPGEIRGLLKACRALAESRGPGLDEKTTPPPFSGGELFLPPREAVAAVSTRVPLRAAAGRVAAGWVAAYPPGIPLWIPGERITGAMVEWALAFQAAGGCLRGVQGDLTPVVAGGARAGKS